MTGPPDLDGIAEVHQFRPRPRSERESEGARFDAPPQGGADEAPSIVATPWTWRDPASIPRRRWVYGHHLIRGFVSATVAPGALGKSSLVIGEALAMVTGRPLLETAPESAGRVWLWNGEDPQEELDRRIAAACLHHKVTSAMLDGRLLVNSGRDTDITIATLEGFGVKIAVPVVRQLVATIQANRIDVVVIDPFVSSHKVGENDNTAIDAVVKQWAKIAHETGCAIELVHHVRKGSAGQTEHTVDDARGASALIAAARSARVLNRMSEKEAEQCRIENRFPYFRVADGKANLAPMSEKSEWYHLASVALGNGEPDDIHDRGDWIGAVERWTWPDMLAEVTVAQLRECQRVVAAGRYRKDVQAREWVGTAIAPVLQLDPENDRRRLLSILKTWVESGMFVVVEGEDAKRNKRSFVEVGTWATD